MSKKQIELVNKIMEAFNWLNEDLSYVQMSGIVELKDEDIETYTRENVEEQSFDHWYEWSQIYSEDSSRGEILIPLIGDKYMKFDFNS